MRFDTGVVVLLLEPQGQAPLTWQLLSTDDVLVCPAALSCGNFSGHPLALLASRSCRQFLQLVQHKWIFVSRSQVTNLPPFYLHVQILSKIMDSTTLSSEKVELSTITRHEGQVSSAAFELIAPCADRAYHLPSMTSCSNAAR